MRINRFLASSSTLSRRAADQAIADGRVLVNGQQPTTGHQVTPTDVVTLDGQPVQARQAEQTIMLNKPVGYVVSRQGQGHYTVYDLLPPELHHLKPIGRLDKDSSGLLLLTTDGVLAEQLSHPRYAKRKIYLVTLDDPLNPHDQQAISEQGIQLDDGLSRLGLTPIGEDGRKWVVVMSEGRNRQIRRTFAKLGYTVVQLHRTHFGDYSLPAELRPGSYYTVQM